MLLRCLDHIFRRTDGGARGGEVNDDTRFLKSDTDARYNYSDNAGAIDLAEKLVARDMFYGSRKMFLRSGGWRDAPWVIEHVL